MDPDLDKWSADLAGLPYPPELRCIDRGITGEGFYPGARRCLFGDVAAPSVMLLGRDFGTLSYFSSLAATLGRSEHALTWRHTREIYVKRLFSARVFCTNYLMGVRVEGSAKGDLRERLSPSTWEMFETACWSFFQKQLADTRPDLIVVFGADNARDLRVENRLTGRSDKVLYAPHPHSAIGAKKAAPHLAAVEEIKQRPAL